MRNPYFMRMVTVFLFWNESWEPGLLRNDKTLFTNHVVFKVYKIQPPLLEDTAKALFDSQNSGVNLDAHGFCQ